MSGGSYLGAREEIHQLICCAQSKRTKFICLRGEVFVTEDFILRYLRGLPMLDLADVERCPDWYNCRGDLLLLGPLGICCRLATNESFLFRLVL